ncbi:hypothetical protein DFH06DRAFT_1317081 [Mycena polygramma]|nr:hypothetical protein DFH06DRAFT_1317081 [Mycena polygramma]
MVDDGALVVPEFRITDCVTRHACGPQDSDSKDDSDEDEEVSPTAKSDVITAARLRWEALPTPPPPPSPSPSAPMNVDAEQARLAAQKAKKKRRELLRDSNPSAPKEPKAVVRARIRQASPFTVPFSMQSYELPVASSGWMGLRNPPAQDFEPENREYDLAEARAIPGMTVVDWQGKPGPIVDADASIVSLYGSWPRDAKWQADVAQPAADLMQEAANGIYDHVFSGVYYGTRQQEKRRRQSGKPTPLEQKIPRRGPHRAKTIGNSMGGGQETPSPFFHTVLNRIVLTGLLATEPFQRIAGFTNAMFQSYAPDLHGYYHRTLDRLHRWNPRLKRNFLPALSVFAAATFNFGPATVTLPHLDFANLAWGWCAITALGDFDPDKGGHLILWDLKLII